MTIRKGDIPKDTLGAKAEIHALQAEVERLEDVSQDRGNKLKTLEAEVYKISERHKGVAKSLCDELDKNKTLDAKVEKLEADIDWLLYEYARDAKLKRVDIEMDMEAQR